MVVVVVSKQKQLYDASRTSFRARNIHRCLSAPIMRRGASRLATRFAALAPATMSFTSTRPWHRSTVGFSVSFSKRVKRCDLL